MFVPIATPPPSPGAQALAQGLAQHVRERRAEDPSLEAHDVRQAFALARHQLAGELGASSARSRALAAGMAVLAAALGLAVALFRVQP